MIIQCVDAQKVLRTKLSLARVGSKYYLLFSGGERRHVQASKVTLLLTTVARQSCPLVAILQNDHLSWDHLLTKPTLVFNLRPFRHMCEEIIK